MTKRIISLALVLVLLITLLPVDALADMLDLGESDMTASDAAISDSGFTVYYQSSAGLVFPVQYSAQMLVGGGSTFNAAPLNSSNGKNATFQISPATAGTVDSFGMVTLFPGLADNTIITVTATDSATGTSYARTFKVLTEGLGAKFQGGYGTPERPYLVNTKTHFNNIRTAPYSHFLLTSNIALGNMEPLGDFYGVLDGNYYTVSGWRHTYNASGNFGLFNTISSGAGVYNLVLSDCQLTCADGAYGSLYAGIVCGKNAGVIKNVRVVSSKVTGDMGSLSTDADSHTHVGGICGTNLGKIHGSGVVSSTISGYSGSYRKKGTANTWVGGISGIGQSAAEYVDVYSHSNVMSATAKGDTRGWFTTGACAWVNAGGVIGRTDGSYVVLTRVLGYANNLNDCTAEGEDSQLNRGSIIGYMFNTNVYLTSCYSETSDTMFGRGTAGSSSNVGQNFAALNASGIVNSLSGFASNGWVAGSNGHLEQARPSKILIDTSNAAEYYREGQPLDLVNLKFTLVDAAGRSSSLTSDYSISGYDATWPTDTQTVTVQYGSVSGKFTCTKLPAYTVAIHCSAPDGTVLLTDTHTVEYMDSYSFAAPRIPGYTTSVTDISGVMDVHGNEVIDVPYEPNVYNYTVKYVLAEDETVELSPTITGKRTFDEDLYVDSPSILGYRLLNDGSTLDVNDSVVKIPGDYVGDYTYIVRYAKAEDRFYSVYAMLGSTYLDGVEVTFNGITKVTDPRGCAVFYYPEGLQETVVTASKEGYVSGKYENGHTIFLNQDLPVHYVDMKLQIDGDPNYILEGISCYGEDIVNGTGVINTAYDEEIEIIVKGQIPYLDSIKSIQIVQDVDEIDPSTGNATGKKIRKVLQTKYPDSFSEKDGSCTFMIKGTQFEYKLDGSNKIYAYMNTEWGAEPVVKELRISTVKLGTEFVFDGLFDEMSVSLKDTGLSFLDNTKLSFSMNEGHKFENPFSFEFKNNEIYVSYNLSDDFNYQMALMAPGVRRAGNSAQNRVQSFLRHMTEKADQKLEDNKLLHRKGSADVKVEADAAAGMCFIVHGDQTVSSYNYFKVCLLMQASWTTDYVIVFIPITINVTLGLEGEVIITGLSLDFAHMDIIWPSLEVSLTFKMGISAGLGCRYASVGVFARLSIGCTLHLGEEVYFDALILNGEAGFYAKLDLGLFTLYGEKSWKFLEKKIHLVPQGKAVNTSQMTQSDGVYYVGQYNGLPVYDIDNYEMTLANSGISPEIDWEVPNATLLTDDISERAGGKIYKVNEKQIAIYFTEVSDRDPANAKILTYQVKNSGSWSDPAYVCDNGTSDTVFDAIVHNDVLYLVYSEANKAFSAADYSDDADLIREMSLAQEITVAKFDLSRNTFQIMKQITQDGAYDTMPTFGVADNSVYLTWNKNTAEDNSVTFGENRKNDIWYCKLEGESWTSPVCLIHNCYPVVDLALTKLNGRMSVAMIVDEDLNLLSTEDRNIYLVKNNGDRSQIDCYGTQISQLETHTINNTPTLLWKADNAVMAYDGEITGVRQLSGENLSIPGEYCYVTSLSGVGGLFWTASEGESNTNFYYSFSYDKVDWGAPMVAQTVPHYVTDYSVAFEDSGYSILFTDTFVQTTTADGEQDLSSYSKLCYLEGRVPSTLTVVSHEIERIPDSDIFTVAVTVRNDGMYTLNYMDLLLTEVVYTENVSDEVTADGKPVDENTFQYHFKEININLKAGQSVTIQKTQNLLNNSTLDDYEITATIGEGPDSSISGGVTTPGGGWDDDGLPSTPIFPEEIPVTEYGTSDKVVIYETMRPDFAIAGEYVILGETEYLSVKVANVGEVSGSGILKLYRLEEDADQDGQPEKILVHEVEIQALQVGHQKFYLIKLEKDFFAETRQEFVCVLDCPEETILENNTASILAYKLAGAPGTEEDVLVEAPVLDSYTQNFDKYEPEDVVMDVTLNEDILGYYGCVDAQRDNVDHTVQELDGNILRLTFPKDTLMERDVAHHEFTLYFKTAAGYIQTLFLMKVVDNTPIPLSGNIVLMQTISDPVEGILEFPVNNPLRRGMNLHLDVSSVNTQALQYHWLIDGVEVSTESVYQITQSDLGKTLQVSVTGAAPYFGTLYTGEFTIEKVNRELNQPVISEDNGEGLLVLRNDFQIGDDKVAYGYAMIDDPTAVTNWSISKELSLPESGTYYIFCAMLSSNVYQDAYSGATVYTYEEPCQHPSYVDGICPDCGEKDPNYVAITLQYPTLLLEDEIKLNVYFTVEPSLDVASMGMLTWTTKPETIDIHTAESVVEGALYHDLDGNYSVASLGIPAQKLGDKVYFCIYALRPDGTYAYSRQISYSPASFAYSQLSKSTVSNVAKSLYVSILNYGAEAQIYTGYRTDALINRNLTAEMLEYSVAYSADMIQAISKPNAEKQGQLYRTDSGFSSRIPTISLDSAFAINYYFVPDRTPAEQMQFFYWNISDYLAADVLSVDNSTGQMTMIETTDGYKATVPGIAAKDIGEPLYVCGTYTDEEGNVYSTGILSYSIGAFCGNQVNKGSEECKPLAAAIAVYGYCAADYFVVQ